MDVWIEDYKTMVSLYNAAKCAGLEADKLSECYFNIEKVFEDMINAQKLRATFTPWEKVSSPTRRLSATASGSRALLRPGRGG